jgi:hypothetical protein
MILEMTIASFLNGTALELADCSLPSASAISLPPIILNAIAFLGTMLRGAIIKEKLHSQGS